MNTKTISVIITSSLKSENMLRCINSVLNQINKANEIIIIGNNCDNKTKNSINDLIKDNNIKLYINENKSIINIRKEAAQKAISDYILFIDGNDFIEDNAIDNLTKIINKTQIPIIISPITSDYVEGNIIEKIPISHGGGYEQADYIKYVYDFLFNTNTYNYFNLYYGKLFKKELFTTYYNLPDDITYEENTVFMTYLLLSVDEIYINDNSFYHRNKKENFVFIQDDYVYQIQKVYDYLEEFFKTLDNSENLLKILGNYYINVITKDYHIMKFIKYDLDLYKIFPLNPEIKNIVIHGAGEYGRFCYSLFSKKTNVNIVAWTDKNLSGQTVDGVLIENPINISKMEYDFLILGVVNINVIDEIKRELLEVYGVKEDKIIWHGFTDKKKIKN